MRFVVNDAEVRGQPVGVTVTKDGALLISEDASATIWRISHSGKAAQAQQAGGRVEFAYRPSANRKWLRCGSVSSLDDRGGTCYLLQVERELYELASILMVYITHL